MVRAWAPRKIWAQPSATGGTASAVYSRACHFWSRRGSPSAAAAQAIAPAARPSSAPATAPTPASAAAVSAAKRPVSKAPSNEAPAVQHDVDRLEDADGEPGGGAEHHAAGERAPERVSSLQDSGHARKLA